MSAFRAQIGDIKWTYNHGKRHSGRWMKKQVIRYWRRKAKEDPENAPVKRPIKMYD